MSVPIWLTLTRHLPALHVVFGHAVLDRHDWVARDEVGQVACLLPFRPDLALPAIVVRPILEKLRGGRIECEHDIRAWDEPRFLDGLHDEIERRVG